MDRSLRAAVEAESAAGRRVGLLAPERWHDTGAAHFYSLNEGRAVDYARLLYTGLRTLDECEVDVILCPGIEAVGVGYAVMNRLLKAGEEI
jgi:L-threonylcarbamoyladenylate synthase